MKAKVTDSPLLEVKKYLAEIGRKGGSKKSDAKTKAARENIKKRWSKKSNDSAV